MTTDDQQQPRANGHRIGSGGWLRERFPEKDWHQHRRTDRRADWCDGTPSDCGTKERIDA